ncbi:MAG: HAD family hydrolase, partial [Candidatus Hodarchaeales archaeon]
MVIDLIIWDCDGTLTTVTSSWQWIHERLGTWEKGKQHLDDFLEGNISYEEFAFRDASEWKGL